MLHSEGLKPYDGALSDQVKECLREIALYFKLEKLKVLKFSETRIAIPVTFRVALPTRGAIGGIDIRDEEPALIVISLRGYPGIMPSIMNDRKDFPKKYLPHLYVSKEDAPAPFCLVRNSPNEWFANKRIPDLLTVASQWLYKAGNGLLVEDNNEYDPARLESAHGRHIYRYNMLYEVVSNNREFAPGCGYAILLSNIEKSEISTTYKSTSTVSHTEIDSLIQFFKKTGEKLDKLEVKPQFTIVVWNDSFIVKEYNVQFPNDFKELKQYFANFNIDIEGIIKNYIQSGYQLRNGIPIIHGIKRPNKLVGQGGNYEFINFGVFGGVDNEGVIPEDAETWVQIHNEPFSFEMARTLTNEDRSASTIYIGAGSLGSKIIMHDARSGKRKITVIDDDRFLEHNLARHVLFEDDISLNKASSIVSKITNLYKCDDTSGYTSLTSNLVNVDLEKFENHNWMVDTSASRLVHNEIVNRNFPENLNIARCELVDDGSLGLLYIEGTNRNPRIDDLMHLTHFMAVNNPYIQKWRRTDEQRELTTLEIGQGCSSSTTVMPDDTISFHASLFSKVLYQHQHRKAIQNKGFLFRSVLVDGPAITTTTEYDIVDPFEVYSCVAGSGWQVRLMNGLTKALLNNCRRKGRIETGGCLLGVANYKTKTIHCFQVIMEPKGSQGSYANFVRGIGGLPEMVNYIKEVTGQVIGYIGEWHSHPMGLEKLSSTDLETVALLQKYNRRVPIPTLSLIVTNNKILPFVFE